MDKLLSGCLFQIRIQTCLQHTETFISCLEIENWVITQQLIWQGVAHQKVVWQIDKKNSNQSRDFCLVLIQYVCVNMRHSTNVS